jgi:hypothetical protein
MGPGGDYMLLLNSDRSAVLEVGVGKGFGVFSEVRTGSFMQHDGFWTLTVKTPDTKSGPGREYVYAIVSHSATDLSLLDDRGNLVKFHKIV